LLFGIRHRLPYMLAILTGTVLTAVCINLLKSRHIGARNVLTEAA